MVYGDAIWSKFSLKGRWMTCVSELVFHSRHDLQPLRQNLLSPTHIYLGFCFHRCIYGNAQMDIEVVSHRIESFVSLWSLRNARL